MAFIWDSLTSIYDTVKEVINNFVSIFEACQEGISALLTVLNQTDDYLVGMAGLTDVAGVTGYPVVQAVATIKYLMPLDIFYFLYIGIVIGVTLAILKLIALILSLIDKYILKTSSGFSMGSILSKVSSLWRR